VDQPDDWTFDMRPCPRCGTLITQVADRCRFCGADVTPVVRDDGDVGSGTLERMLVPVGRPASAIAAGYLGLFSLLPFVGIVAVVVSLFALRTLRRNPRLSGRGRAYFGLIMGAVMTLVYAIPIVMLVIEAVDAAQGRRPRF
jgi:hypothetical protein